MIRLSIIIPHFNSPNSLKRLLDSIPKKQEIQIVVIDDNSNQGVEMLNLLSTSVAYNHVTFLINNTNKKGAGACRNIGIEEAIGEWVLFADSDDFFIEGFYNYIKQYFNSENDVVFFIPTSLDITTGNKSDRHVSKEEIIETYIKNKDLEAELSLRYRIVVPWSKLIKGDFLQNNNISFDEVLASNDVIFSIKVGYFMKKFEVSRNIIYCVTRSSGTLTTNTSVDVFDSRLMVYVKYCEFLRQNLNEEEINYFEFSGNTFIIQAIKYKLGLKKILTSYLTLKKNNIKVLDIRFLNPLFLVRKSIFHYKFYKKQKKYLVK